MHNPEPWTITVRDRCRIEVRDGDGKIVMFLESCDGDLDKLLGNAGRMMVCTNLCAGVPTDVVESICKGMLQNSVQ